MTIETKITIHATEKDVEPLRNFLEWLEDMECDVANACDKILSSEIRGISTDTIYALLDTLLSNIEVD
jgi:hypothetical protein